MTNINFKQFRDEFGNIIQEFEVIEYHKNSNGEWVKVNTFPSSSTHYNVDGQLYYKSGSMSFKLNMDFESNECGACYAIGNLLENKKKITGNFVLGEYSLPKKYYTLNKQTYLDGTCHYTIKDEYGNSRLEHSSSYAENIISQMKREIEVYSNNIQDYNRDVCKLIIEMNRAIIQVLTKELKEVA